MHLPRSHRWRRWVRPLVAAFAFGLVVAFAQLATPGASAHPADIEVTSDGPAAQAGIRAGDLIEGIGPGDDAGEMQGVARVADVESFLGDKRAPQHIRLSLARGPEMRVAQIQLARRQARTEL